LTIEAIAARAGVGKQTIYRWWPSKGAVVFDAFLAEQESEDCGHDLPDNGDLEADLKAVLRATAANLLHPHADAQYRALTSEIQHDPVLAAEFLARLP
jgi:AcrR family transcriptional regulator